MFINLIFLHYLKSSPSHAECSFSSLDRLLVPILHRDSTPLDFHLLDEPLVDFGPSNCLNQRKFQSSISDTNLDFLLIDTTHHHDLLVNNITRHRDAPSNSLSFNHNCVIDFDHSVRLGHCSHLSGALDRIPNFINMIINYHVVNMIPNCNSVDLNFIR